MVDWATGALLGLATGLLTGLFVPLPPPEPLAPVLPCVAGRLELLLLLPPMVVGLRPLWPFPLEAPLAPVLACNDGRFTGLDAPGRVARRIAIVPVGRAALGALGSLATPWAVSA